MILICAVVVVQVKRSREGLICLEKREMRRERWWVLQTRFSPVTCIIQFSSVQSIDQLSCRGYMMDSWVEILSQWVLFFFAGGHCEQFLHGQECPLFEIVHPAFLLLTMAFPALQCTLKDGFGKAVLAYDIPIPKTNKRLKRMLFNQTKQDRMQRFEELLFFKAKNNAKTNKSLIFLSPVGFLWKWAWDWHILNVLWVCQSCAHLLLQESNWQQKHKWFCIACSFKKDD